jgi:hypothetical protein
VRGVQVLCGADEGDQWDEGWVVVMTVGGWHGKIV